RCAPTGGWQVRDGRVNPTRGEGRRVQTVSLTGSQRDYSLNTLGWIKKSSLGPAAGETDQDRIVRAGAPGIGGDVIDFCRLRRSGPRTGAAPLIDLSG